MTNIRCGQHGLLCGVALGVMLALAACGGSSSSTGPGTTDPPTDTTDPADPGTGPDTTEPPTDATDPADPGTGPDTTDPSTDATDPADPGTGPDTTDPPTDTTDPADPGTGPDTPDTPTDTAIPTEPDGGTGATSRSIAWGPRIGMSDLSPLSGAEDAFGPDLMAALVRAARAVPNGASQSSVVEADGRTADQVTVHVVYDEDVGNQVHEITDGARLHARVPFIGPRQGLRLALFTDLIPGIEPDLSSYPHEVLGVWAWDGGAEAPEGEVGAFWSSSPPSMDAGSRAPVSGTATYEGDAVGLLAGAGRATTFAADVTLTADFDDRTVGGTVGAFRSLAGTAIPAPPLTLGTATFSPQGDPFWGDTTSGIIPGGGKWGARWTDDAGTMMGGTFGFAAADGATAAVLGAFTAAQAGASADGGDPDDPVATTSP